MIPRIILLQLMIFLFLLTFSHAWKCGIDTVTEKLSWLIAYPASQAMVNQCCIEHDNFIEQGRLFGISREESDRIFCHCLEGAGGSYAKYIIKPIFCTAVKCYTFFNKYG